MSSLVAWFGVTEKKRLRVVQVDTDANEAVARALDVSTVPTLVLLRGKTVVDRLDGRATGKQISRMISRTWWRAEARATPTAGRSAG